MSVLAGYDLVLEITLNAVLRFLEAKLPPLFGVPTITPPFDYSISASLGTVHIIVKDMHLDIGAPWTIFSDPQTGKLVHGTPPPNTPGIPVQTLSLTMDFNNGSIISDQITIDSLTGSISLTVPILNTNLADTPSLAFSLLEVAVSISGVPLDLADANTAIQQALLSQLNQVQVLD